MGFQNVSDDDLAKLLSEVRQLSSLPYVATPKQMEFHNHPARGSKSPVLYGGAYGGGKSAALCAEAIRECIDVPGNKVLLGRKELVVFKRTTLVELLKLLENVPYEITHRITEQRFLFPNGSELHYTGLGTEKDREKLKGLEIGMLGIDEASEITRDTFQTAAARLRHGPADKADRLKARLTSNPEPGWLKEDFIDNPVKMRDEDTGEILRDANGEPIIAYHYIPATMKDNPHIGKSYMSDLKQMFADNPAWAKAYIDGNWDAISTQDQILDTFLVSESMTLERQKQTPYGWPCIWGLDVAREGDDHTVLVQRRGYKFDILANWSKYLTDKTIDNVIIKYRESEIKPSTIYVDDIGVGGGVLDGLRKAGLPAVGVNVGSQARHHQRYSNLKAEVWFTFKRMVETGLVALPNDPELKTELTSIRYEFIPATQKIQVEDKKSVKKKLGRSPDEADALVLAAWEGSQSFVLYDKPEDRKPINVLTSDPGTVDQMRRASISKLLKAMRHS